MHRQLKELLPTAKGSSQLVVVVFLDIRGFSSFAKIAESSEAALFLRSMYLKILDDYFANATFFKPTGDGLLIILDYDESNLSEVVNTAIGTSLRLVEDFATLTSDDAMVNFEVPSSLGIGIARGAATALMSSDRVLDYSGRPLNLAARLMDLARPQGVVFSGTIGLSLIREEIKDQFTEEDVYVKGIADDVAMSVYIQKDSVVLSESSKHPIGRYDRKTLAPESLTVKEVGDRGTFFLHELPSKPVATNDISVYVDAPGTTSSGRRHPTIRRTREFPAIYRYQQGTHYARVNYDDINEALVQRGMRTTWPVTITIEYSVYPDT